MSNIIETLVVDDEPLAAALISSYVDRTPFLHLAAEVHSAEEALEFVQAHSVELVYLDIKMPKLSGMQLARLLPEGVRVVFTTAYSDHAVEGFRSTRSTTCSNRSTTRSSCSRPCVPCASSLLPRAACSPADTCL